LITLKDLICLETNAIATEQHQSFEVDEIVFVANDDATNSVIFNFDESSGADTNKHGLDSAYMLLSELAADYIAHCALVGGTPCHSAADTVNNDPTALGSKTLADMITTANSLKAKYNAHDAEFGVYHVLAGTAHQVSSADATTLSALITLINEIKSDYEAHRIDDDAHGLIDTTNVITTADAQSGDMTVKKGELHYELIDRNCHTLYFKSSTSTVPFRIWGTKLKYKA
jgi:hypothetical protein